MSDFIDEDPFDPDMVEQHEHNKARRLKDHDEALVEYMKKTREAYARVFNGGATKADCEFVKHDLAYFCQIATPWQGDQRTQDRMAARREVYQRIVEYSGLDLDTLILRYIEAQPN